MIEPLKHPEKSAKRKLQSFKKIRGKYSKGIWFIGGYGGLAFYNQYRSWSEAPYLRATKAKSHGYRGRADRLNTTIKPAHRHGAKKAWSYLNKSVVQYKIIDGSAILKSAKIEASVLQHIFGREAYVGTHKYRYNPDLKKVVLITKNAGPDAWNWLEPSAADSSKKYIESHFATKNPLQQNLIALHLVLQVAALHANGYRHNDIKPENFCIKESGKSQLIDFGSAEKLNDKERKGIKITKQYAAPELLRGTFDQKSSKSDLFSMGKMLAKLLPELGINIANNSQDKSHQYYIAGRDITLPARAKEGIQKTVCSLLSLEPEHRASINDVIKDLCEKIEKNAANYCDPTRSGDMDFALLGTVRKTAREAKLIPEFYALYLQVTKERCRLQNKRGKSTTAGKLEALAIDILNTMQGKKHRVISAASLEALKKFYLKIAQEHKRFGVKHDNTSVHKNCHAFLEAHKSKPVASHSRARTLAPSSSSISFISRESPERHPAASV